MALQQQPEDALEVYDVQLQILSGQGLPSKDIGGKSDPFVKISIAGQRAQTKVVKNSLDPEFNESFSFRFFSNPRSLRFEVMDEDKLSNDKMGAVDFDLGEMLSSRQPPIFQGALKLSTKGTLQVRIAARRFCPRSQQETISKQDSALARNQETISRQQQTLARQKDTLSKQTARIESLQRSLAQAEAQAMAQPGAGSSNATKRSPSPTQQKTTRATKAAQAALALCVAQVATLWQLLLSALYALPLVDGLVLALGSLLRLGSGLTVLAGATSSKRPPNKLLKLYERENSGACKVVREALSSLDLDCVIYPVPAPASSGAATRFGDEAQRLSGQAGALPVLVDENYGDNGPLVMNDAQQIVRYLRDEYGNNVKLTMADRVRERLVATQLVRGLYEVVYLGLLRAMQGRQRACAVRPAKLLELWSYEASPFCVKVREVLCALEIPYVLKNVAHGSQQKRGEFQIRFGKKYPAWKQKMHALQLPLLIDANTNTELFNAGDIEKYLVNTYCATA